MSFVLPCALLFFFFDWQAAGKNAVQGKDYIVQDGDIMHFRFGK
jgi:ribosome-binding ATPase YchF (GTP1/OBG family)